MEYFENDLFGSKQCDINSTLLALDSDLETKSF